MTGFFFLLQLIVLRGRGFLIKYRASHKAYPDTTFHIYSVVPKDAELRFTSQSRSTPNGDPVTVLPCFELIKTWLLLKFP